MAELPSITIVGIGPGDPGARTFATQQALERASTIILRTMIHPGLDDFQFDPRVVACDDIYESSESFEKTYQLIVERVLDAASNGPVVYVVPGSPTYGERTVRLLATESARRGIPLTILPAISALETIATESHIDLLIDQPQLVDALDLIAMVNAEPFSRSLLHLNPARHLIIGQVFDRHVAGNVKHALTRIYPEDHLVAITTAAGTPQQIDINVSIAEIDHQDHDHLTTIVVPPLDLLSAHKSPATLFRIIARLRAPGGCPWDRKQTLESLRDKIIEEAHEAAEAIVNEDPDEIRDELGDLLLLVALCAQIAEEAGDFTIEDVFEAVNTKLIRRHPHVFGNVVANTPEDVLQTWSRVKEAEKAEESEPRPALRYDQLPRSLSVVERIRRSESQVLTGANSQSDELGAQLLTLIESALESGIDPEAALESAYRTAKMAAIN